MPLVEWLSSMWEISFPAGRGGDGGEDVLLLEVEVAPVLRAMERLKCHGRRRRSICKVPKQQQKHYNTFSKALTGRQSRSWTLSCCLFGWI